MNMTPHEFELLIGRMRAEIEDPTAYVGRTELGVVSWKLSDFAPKLADDPTKVRRLLDVMILLRASAVRRRRPAEETLLRGLVSLADRGLGQVYKALEPGALAPAVKLTPSPTDEGFLGVLGELRDFAGGCFSYKRARDSFARKRRALAFDILGAMARVVDLPETVVLARQTLAKGKGDEVRSALDFLVEYCVDRDDLIDEALIGEIRQMTERTDSESCAFGGLDALVNFGAIGEMEAMNCLDNWRERHSGK
jgi:hypothetical protein